MCFSRPCVLASALALCAGSVIFARSASAQVWNEVPDAPRLAPGQQTFGFGPLLEIRGELTGGLRGFQTDFEDVFCIRITDPVAFSASTIGGANFDTQLWLFDSSGFGIVFNDNAVTPNGEVLQSRISNEQLQWLTEPGVYTLAISGYNTDAATGVNTAIWLDTPRNTQRAPDGPGAAGQLSGWNPGPDLNDDFGVYTIFLTGCEFCIPSPGAGWLIAAGAWATGASRRRRRA